METKPSSSTAQIVLRASFKRVMRILPAAFICLMTLTFAQNVRAEATNRYTVVARKLIDLLNAGDYAGVQKLFNPQMSKALPPQKASEFFSGLATQFGKMEKFDGPTGNASGGSVGFRLHCERGELMMNLALDAGDKIAGLDFRPAPQPSAETVRAEETKRYSVVARKLIDLLNAGDYAAAQKLFNPEMSKALPPKEASEFFSGLATQLGKMEKFDGPTGNASGGSVGFRLHCERGELMMNLALDAGDKIAGLDFRPAPQPSAETVRAEETKRYSVVARKLIDLLNAGDYAAVQKLFNPEMNKALPPKEAFEFSSGLATQFGNIEKFEGPTGSGPEGRVFRLRCQRGELMMTLALDTDDKIAGLYFPPPPEPSGNEPKKNQAQLALPFKGRWLVFWGGDTRELNQHHDLPAQRHALDLQGADDSGQTHRGDGTKNEDYFCFGREIYAPAEGVVVEAIDGVRDNTPGSMNPYCLVGNCVVIQHRTNEFSVLAHFQRGSLAVKAGDRVQRGQLVGKCGNSGNSSEPHLHYHLQDLAIFQDALGIKCVFDKVPLVGDGATKLNYSPIKGDVINVES